MKNIALTLLCLALFAVKAISQDTLKSEGQIPILGWYGIPAEETTIARYTEMKEAGFTHNFSGLGNVSNVQKALDTAYAVGMKIIISCGELNSDPENTVARFMDHPALAGYYLRDEPSMNAFSGLGEWARRIQAVDSTHFCYLNLLPTYASSSQLGTSDYRTHVNTFMNTVPLQFYSYDHYPFTSDLVGPFRSGYYENLEIFSDEAKKAGKPFWAFAMATAIDGAYPIPTTAALRLQMFSNLAYGAQGLQYFTYWTPPCGGECFHDGPIYNGEKMEVYYMVQEVSQEIKNLSGVFLGSKMVSVSHTGSIPQGTTRLRELPEQIKALDTQGTGAVVSVLERDSLAFLTVVNRDFRNSMKLIIKRDSTVQRVQKNGVLVPSAILHISTIEIGPGDIAVFTWPKGDSIHFVPVKNQLVNLPLDYDLKDMSGNKLNASDAGSVPVAFEDDQERGRVAYFDESSYAVFPDSSSLHFGTEDFSFALWVKIPPVSGTPVILSNKDFSNETEAGFSLYLDNAGTSGTKQWGVNFADGSGNVLNWESSVNEVGNIADDQWHFVAVSFERNRNMNVCLDGAVLPGSVDMSACPGNAWDGSHDSRLSLMQDGTGAHASTASGYMDRLRFWSRALETQEMGGIYASDTTGNSPAIVYLPMDSDLKDVSGNGFDATDVGTVATTFVSDPERGQVAYFDRLSQAALPKVDPLRFGTRDFAFSLWIKCSPASYTPLIVCNKNWSALGATRKKGFALYTNVSNKSTGDRWSINLGDGISEEDGNGNGIRWNALDNSAPTIADDQWHFIAVSFDRDKTMDVYLDGELLYGSQDLSALPGMMAHDDDNDYPIMLMQDGPGNFYMDIPASMDEFRIWDRPLKISEVASLYNYGLTTDAAEIIIIESSPALNVLVYPNPSKGILNIDFNAEKFENAILQVYSTTGILMKNISIASQPGSNKTTFDVNGWTPGMYLVRVISGRKSKTVRMVVTK